MIAQHPHPRFSEQEPFGTQQAGLPFKQAQGFTLIELLITVCIIGVLAALLVPAIGKVRESSRESACVSNLKQIGLAAMQYKNDNAGHFPSFYDGAVPWITQLLANDYLPVRFSTTGVRGLLGKSVLVCPANPYIYPPPPSNGYVNYAWNWYINDISGAGGTGTLAVNYPNHSRTLLLMDGGATNAYDLSYNVSDTYPAYRLNPVWHRKGGNVAFMDTHVEWVSAQTDKKSVIIFYR